MRASNSILGITVLALPFAFSFPAESQQPGADPVTLGLIESFAKPGGEELQASIRSVKAKEADAFFQLSDSMVNSQAELIIDRARVNKLPTMFLDESSVIKGGLASYAVSFRELGRLSAKYVQRVLGGVKPKDLPVEAVHKIDLTVNLKTAKQIGLMVPPTVLARADKVIK